MPWSLTYLKDLIRKSKNERRVCPAAGELAGLVGCGGQPGRGGQPGPCARAHRLILDPLLRQPRHSGYPAAIPECQGKPAPHSRALRTSAALSLASIDLNYCRFSRSGITGVAAVPVMATGRDEPISTARRP